MLILQVCRYETHIVDDSKRNNPNSDSFDYYKLVDKLNKLVDIEKVPFEPNCEVEVVMDTDDSASRKVTKKGNLYFRQRN